MPDYSVTGTVTVYCEAADEAAALEIAKRFVVVGEKARGVTDVGSEWDPAELDDGKDDDEGEDEDGK